MDERTYTDASVNNLLSEHDITVKVDSDAHPELARRYEDYGWPATVVFNAAGGEIVKRRGYLPPDVMVSMLQEIIRDPSPVVYRDNAAVTAYASAPSLPDALRNQLEDELIESHGFERGGLKQDQKFITRETLEYALLNAQRGDPLSTRLLKLDLDAAQPLIDPVWVGMYQYSTGGADAQPRRSLPAAGACGSLYLQQRRLFRADLRGA